MELVAMAEKRTTWPAWAVALAGASALGSGPGPQPVATPTYLGVQDLVVDGPGAARSVVGPNRAGVQELFSRVVVRTDGGGEGRLRDAGVVGRRIGDLADFWVVEAGSVRAAAGLAERLGSQPGIVEAYVDALLEVGPREIPTDPSLGVQWHLMNQLPESDPLFDINADGAWLEGYTGAGVVVGIIDQGYSLAHPDLMDNHVPEASLENFGANSHGTAVAGLVAAVGNNGQGGAGVAFEAGLGRLYFTGGSSGIADAFLHRNDLIGAKNNSWGPFDNGIARVMPSVERAALQQAIATGRGGKGEIFVWAAGNGALNDDRSDYDPYTTSRFTITVGAIDSSDQASLYSEPGSCVLVAAPSDRDLFSSSDVGIFTTSGATGYTSTFGGTSASSPIACGVVALMLQANPCLTWRDVQHILVETARQNDPTNAGWTQNGAGRWVHYQYGYGAVDAGAATAAAAGWAGVPVEMSAGTALQTVGLALPDADPAGLSGQVTVDTGVTIESVEVTLTVAHTRIGDVSVVLTSPSGTESVFALPRADSGSGYDDYLFTSMRHWGESSLGAWTLKVADETAGSLGSWIDWRVTFNGTDPAAVVCRCDLDGTPGVDVFDLLVYLDLWFAGDLGADEDCSGAVDVFDLLHFLECWFAGCA